MNAGTVIIGASQAGVQLAASLREGGYTNSITLIDSTIHEPYQRPPLSKDYLAGSVETDGLRFRQLDYYASHDIQLALGSPAVSVTREGDGGVITTADGACFPYEHVVLANGAAPRPLPLPGSDLDGVFSLRDADDASALRTSLERARNVVVIGGGFIGLEVASSALKHGKTVTVLEAAPRIIGRAVGEETSAWFLDAHRKRGMRIDINAQLVQFHGAEGHVTEIELADGTRIAADTVIVGIGVIPRTELAEQLGLEVQNGIVVNEQLLASDGRTFAIGDIANAPNPFERGAANMPRVRLESVNNAIDQAKRAAATILGTQIPYASVPWFWSNQGDIKLQMAGLNAGYDRVIVRGDQAADKFSILYFHGDSLLAADCVNSPVDFMAVKQGLTKGLYLDPEKAVDPEPLKKLFV